MISRRRFLVYSSAAVSAPAIISRSSFAQVEQKTVRIGNVLAGPNVAGFILPKYLKEQAGVEAEVVVFPNITQRMQAVASGDVQIGYGGINASIALAGRGEPLILLSNSTDGGWRLLGGDKVKTIADLKGKKCAVQPASTSHLSLQWRLHKEGIADDVELVFMNNNDMPVAMQRGDIDAQMIFEPYCAFSLINGWGKPIWDPYDTPMGKTNVGVIASPSFVEKNPNLTKAIITAHKAAVADLVKDNSAAVDAVVKSLNMSPEVAKESLKNIFFTTESGPEFRKHVEALGDMMVEAKMAEKVPDWNKFFNTSFL
jgi:ABC-type nitrate/sulfonate/bicarbonate transport system substrate-binding protein